ncbi:MAG: cytochrome c-type biogenesis protein [Actinomycetota bacterium]
MRARSRSWAFLAAAALLATGGLLLAVLRGPSRPASLDDQVELIASGLRCPVCQNLSVADSPSQLAQEMRATIATRLRAGESAAEIKGYFRDRYGEWILLIPPKAGIGMIAWLGPVLAIAAGGTALAIALRRRESFPETAVTEEERARIARELALVEEPD